MVLNIDLMLVNYQHIEKKMIREFLYEEIDMTHIIELEPNFKFIDSKGLQYKPSKKEIDDRNMWYVFVLYGSHSVKQTMKKTQRLKRTIRKIMKRHIYYSVYYVPVKDYGSAIEQLKELWIFK